MIVENRPRAWVNSNRATWLLTVVILCALVPHVGAGQVTTALGLQMASREGVAPGGYAASNGLKSAANIQNPPSRIKYSREPLHIAARQYPKLESAYARLPLSFEANVGQTDGRVKFLSRGAGYSLFLTPTDAVFSQSRRAKQAIDATTLRMRLVGANQNAPAAGADELPGRSSYFVGRDPRGWRSGIANYGKVKFSGVYPGIDLVYYGNQRRLEYDFIVTPGADPRAIGLAFPGARRVAVDASGALEIGLPGQVVRWQKPVIYQKIDGRRKAVAGRFVVRRDRRVGFEVARYDARRPLVIDPTLTYVTYLGGDYIDIGKGIAVGSDGVYVVGDAGSANFPVSPGAFQPRKSQNGADVFVLKMDLACTHLLYSTYLGGSIGAEEGNAVAVDSKGIAYVTGFTSGGFPVTASALQFSPPSGGSAFVTKLSADGGSLLYSTYLGGDSDNYGNGIAVDSAENVYVVGYTGAANFPTKRAFQAALKGGPAENAFIVRLDTRLSGAASLVYGTYCGGHGPDYGNAIATNGAGTVFITGKTYSPDFPIRGGFQGTGNVSSGDAFLVKVNTNLSGDASLIYATCLGGTGYEDGRAIAYDPAGAVTIVGQTASADLPVRNAFQPAYGGNNDAFIAKFNTGLTGDASLIYSTYLGDAGSEDGRGVAVDVRGNASVTGSTSDPNTGVSDVFVANLSADGSKLRAITTFGGSQPDYGYAIALDAAGNAYVTGQANSNNLPVTTGALEPRKNGVINAFLVKVAPVLAGGPDLLFQNRASGSIAYWQMNGSYLVDFGLIDPRGAGSPDWKVVGMADFDRDDSRDILFQNQTTGDLAFWLLNGATQTRIGSLSPKNPGVSWKVAGVADMNGDGAPDIVFQNSASGDIYVWYMDGTRMISGAYLNTRNPGSGWKIAAIGDLDGDGNADLVFQHATTGNVYVWYLRGDILVSGGFLSPANPGTGWNVAALADLDGDGKPEILFQNAATGQLAYWVMNGLDLLYFDLPQPSNPGSPDWKLVGAR